MKLTFCLGGLSGTFRNLQKSFIGPLYYFFYEKEKVKIDKISISSVLHTDKTWEWRYSSVILAQTACHTCWHTPICQASPLSPSGSAHACPQTNNTPINYLILAYSLVSLCIETPLLSNAHTRPWGGKKVAWARELVYLVITLYLCGFHRQ